MSTDFGQTATAVEEIAIGAAKTAREVASNPVGSARRQVRNLERKGTPTVRRINRRINALLPDRITLFGVAVNQKLPENLAVKGLHLVKSQTRHADLRGTVAKRTLRVFHGSFRTIARTASRLEQASELAPRAAERKPAVSRARRPARRRAA